MPVEADTVLRDDDKPETVQKRLSMFIMSRHSL